MSAPGAAIAAGLQRCSHGQRAELGARDAIVHGSEVLLVHVVLHLLVTRGYLQGLLSNGDELCGAREDAYVRVEIFKGEETITNEKCRGEVEGPWSLLCDFG